MPVAATPFGGGQSTGACIHWPILHDSLRAMHLTLKRLTIAGLLLCCQSIHAGHAISITTAHKSERERASAAQLDRLLNSHDVSRWAFTQKVVIDEHQIPHSHPVLTLHARHLNDDDVLLSTYVHEQLHWFLSARAPQMDAAASALRAIYPRIPVGFPEGSSDEEGNYVHLVIAYLEHQAMKTLLGEQKAAQVQQFLAKDHYTWIYSTVSKEPEKVGAVIKAHGLLPP